MSKNRGEFVLSWDATLPLNGSLELQFWSQHTNFFGCEGLLHHHYLPITKD
jgi:hypothetical protein